LRVELAELIEHDAIEVEPSESVCIVSAENADLLSIE
jgi:hypothetical protein